MFALVCNFLHNEPATRSPSSLLRQVNATFRENDVMALLPEVGKSNFFRERIVISPEKVKSKVPVLN
jgi:hypothetical protein